MNIDGLSLQTKTDGTENRLKEKIDDVKKCFTRIRERS
jgi:hypothetical protein